MMTGALHLDGFTKPSETVHVQHQQKKTPTLLCWSRVGISNTAHPGAALRADQQIHQLAHSGEAANIRSAMLLALLESATIWKFGTCVPAFWSSSPLKQETTNTRTPCPALIVRVSGVARALSVDLKRVRPRFGAGAD